MATPDPGSALLAMCGALPLDDALVLGLSGPAYSAEQNAMLTSWRLQQAYAVLLAVTPLWSALRQQPAALPTLLAAYADHPWLPLLQRLLPDWLAACADPDTDLIAALRTWQRLHDRHWQALRLPPLAAVTMPLPALPMAPPPAHWQQQLQHWAQQTGLLSSQCLALPHAALPGERSVAWQQDGARLYRYPAATTARPVLLIYAWINRSDVLDLAPSQSLIAALQAQGLAVWLLDWADAGATGCTLDDYVFGLLATAVAAVRAHHDGEPISLLGICQGGTLALSYAALRPDTIASLSLAVTPVDFQCPADRLSALAQTTPVASVAALTCHSPAALNLAFLNLKPFSLRLGKYLSLLWQAPEREALIAFLRMEHWLMNGPLLSGPGLAAYLERYYQHNGLCQQRDALTPRLQLAGEPVQLDALTVPVQLLIAEQDHIVPPAASLALRERLTGELQIDSFATGHIGLLVGRARLAVAEKVAQFVQRHVAQKTGAAR